MSGSDGWATTGNPKSIPAMLVIAATCCRRRRCDRCRRGAGGTAAPGRRRRGPPCARTGRTRGPARRAGTARRCRRCSPAHVVAAVVAAVHAGRRDGDQHPRGVVRMDEHGVQAQPAAARLPLGAMRVVPQPADELEGAPAVVAAEQRRRLDTGVEHVRLVGRAWCELPDPRQRGLGAAPGSAVRPARPRSRCRRGRRTAAVPGPSACSPSR